MKEFLSTNYNDIFRSAHYLMRANWPPVDTEEYVVKLCTEANELSLRYAGAPEETFHYALLHAVLEELCRPLCAAKTAK